MLNFLLALRTHTLDVFLDFAMTNLQEKVSDDHKIGHYPYNMLIVINIMNKK